MRMAVIGAGWAGLSAAVHACQAGHAVHVFEMAHHAGGRARSTMGNAGSRDNGQHILIGAYAETLALMRLVGAEPDRLLCRSALALCYPDGVGLTLPAGHPVPAFVRGVLRARHWTWRERLALLGEALRWRLSGFRGDDAATVADLCAKLPPAVLRDLVEPLCLAALNTPMDKASAQVFLRVLKDALFAGPGAADLLLPCAPLSALLADPATSWLSRSGATLSLGHRVQSLTSDGHGWAVDGLRFDAVVLASTAREAARLIQPISSSWSSDAYSLRYEPIVTVWLRAPGLKCRQAMTALRFDAARPAQFVFDLGALGGAQGTFAFVVSGAADALKQGLSATSAAVRAQAEAAFPGHFLDAACVVDAHAERRATFACTPGLRRPAGHIARGLAAAGDHVLGPYPATLEGAVRSGINAVALASNA